MMSPLKSVLTVESSSTGKNYQFIYCVCSCRYRCLKEINSLGNNGCKC